VDVVVQNLIIDICEEVYSLLSAYKGWVIIVQEEEKEKRGVRGMVSEHHEYIDTCANYTPGK
jgi:hypothetical protein